MVPFSKLYPDVDDSDSWTNTIRISVLVLNVAKATAGVMENPARDLVALLVLGRLAQACQVGSIAKPPNRTAKAKHFCGNFSAVHRNLGIYRFGDLFIPT